MAVAPGEIFPVHTQDGLPPVEVTDAERNVASQLNIDLAHANQDEMDQVHSHLIQRLQTVATSGGFNDVTGEELTEDERLQAVDSLARVMTLPKLSKESFVGVLTGLEEISLEVTGRVGQKAASNLQAIHAVVTKSLEKVTLP